MLKDKGPVKHLNRNRKALMIQAILEDHLDTEIINFKILDVGTGNAQIIKHFSNNNECFAVDTQQPTSLCDKVNFSLVTSEKLPFNDQEFDIVISHHVIEHVENQGVHLSEISRVMREDSITYIACPNKGSPLMKGHIGNDLVPTAKTLREMLVASGFNLTEYYTAFLSNPSKFYCDISLGRYFPSWFIRLFMRWYPSQCYLLRKNGD